MMVCQRLKQLPDTRQPSLLIEMMNSLGRGVAQQTIYQATVQIFEWTLDANVHRLLLRGGGVYIIIIQYGT